MSSPKTTRCGALAALALVTTVTLSAKTAVPDGWFAWPMVEPVAGSALDTSTLNAARAGSLGRIATKDGKYITGDGAPIRFFGVNVSSNDAFPSAEDAERLARRLAKGGMNIARLHHMDNQWSVESDGSLWAKGSTTHLELAPDQLDKVHRLVATLARHGIYTNLNLKVSKTLAPADGFPDSVALLPDFQKRVDLFDRRMIELQKDFARQLLTTKNPYTGLSLAEDPAVAVVEINNENSILGYFTRDLGQGLHRLPEPFRANLQSLWNDWLAGHYSDSADLAAAWAETPDLDASPVLDPATATWSAKIQPGSHATLTPGADGSAFTVDIPVTPGPDWHVQVSTYDLPLKDNTVYTVSFEARAAKEGTIGVGVSPDSRAEPVLEWRSLGLLAGGQIGPEWKTISLAFPAHSVGTGRAMLSFNCSAQPNRIELHNISLVPGAANAGLQPGESLAARNIGIPVTPSTRQWADWIAFLAAADRAFAEEMRTFLRDELKVPAPLVCSQINFTGLPALDREQSMEFADTHMYWQHPVFPGSGWDRANWTIANSPMVETFGPRRFGELGALAYFRVAGKPFAVSEYDHAAPSEYVCEMYPEFAVFACRQDWDALYAFDLGAYRTGHDGRISGYFDQLNHPAKWGLAPFATRVFREGLIAPAPAVAELRPGQPVWGEAMHFDMLWAQLNPDRPFDFLDCRLQVDDRPTAAKATLVRSGTADTPPARVVKAPQGQILIAAAEQAAVATGFLGGTTTTAGPLTITCPRFGRDFATVAAVSLDGRPLAASHRSLVTIVARAENTGMQWNKARNSVGTDWGTGPTIAERVPATITLAADGPRRVFTLKPDGTRARKVKTTYTNSAVTFTVSAKDRTLHYEFVAE